MKDNNMDNLDLDTVLNKGCYPEYEHWLKSLPERFNLQPKQEWSEEDERMIGRMRSVVNKCAAYNGALDVNGDYCEGDYDKLDSWLKSLKPHPHWKPSKEQMESLERASTNKYLSAKQFDILVSLYEQLKKLTQKT